MVTVIVVNHRTLEHTTACVESLRAAYPAVPLILIDNGSGDASADYIADVGARDGAATAVLLDDNRYHGPALHEGMTRCRTPYAFLLDSDCVVRRGGFLETMLGVFAHDPDLYALGSRGWANRRGYFPVSRGEPATHYVHPFACMIDAGKYRRLEPFVHHGAPAYRNMWSATRADLHLTHFTIEDYVTHHGRVTAGRFGYGLDRRLRLQGWLNAKSQSARIAAARVVRREVRPPHIPPSRSDATGPAEGAGLDER